MSETPGASYASAGVDIEAGDRAVELMKEWVKKTQRPEVAGLGGLGGFAGLFDASAFKRYERPLLASATDGVGTKVDIARRLGVYDTIGHDLVAMVMDDIVVCGAEPLFMTDYICVGKVHPERVAAIVKGIAEGCVLVEAAPSSAARPRSTRACSARTTSTSRAAGTGVVEADRLLGPDRIRTGDAVIAMASSGLHSNGYSLVRHVLFDRANLTLDQHVEELGRTLGEELLEPTKIYSLDCLALTRTTDVHAYSHITGGGLAANLARVIPDGLHATVDRSTWAPGAIFDLVGKAGCRGAPGAREDAEHGRRHDGDRPPGRGGLRARDARRPRRGLVGRR